jgi:medium-chain acyl-[acyl-carrier-protein] hydrolase
MSLLPPGERYGFGRQMEIPPYDCDAARRLRLSAALRYAEAVSTGHLEALGMGHSRLYERGIVFVLVGQALKIHRLPVMLETIWVKTSPAAQVGARLTRETLLQSAEGQPLIEVQAAWAMIDPRSRRPLKPSVLALDLPLLEGWHPFINPARMRIGEASTPVMEQTVRYSHLDLNGHMNNTVYADLVLDALPLSEVMTRTPQRLLLKMRREAYPGDVLRIRRDALPDGYRLSGHIGAHTCFEAEMGFDRTQ